MNLDGFRLVGAVPKPRNRARPPRRVAGRFLKGPVPWAWVEAAARLPGRSLHVGLALWHEVGLTDSLVVGLPAKRLRELGVGRSARYRALAGLERAGLVAVERHRGRGARVTIRLSNSGGDDD